jgi:hypothetical protein
VPVIFILLAVFVGIPADYHTGRDICPLVHTVRRELYRFDTGLLYMWKDKFAWACNLEDGYFRLLLDTWVRSISTDSDNLLLLVSAIVRSLLYHAVAVRYVILPGLVAMNAAISFAVHMLLRLVSYLAPDVQLTVPYGLRSVTKLFNSRLQGWIIKHWSLVSVIQLVPPPTTPRERPRTDYIDSFKYWTDRRTRVVEYYTEAATHRLRMLTVLVPVLAVVVRLLCIATNFDWWLRILFLMPGEVPRTSSLPADALGHTIDKIVRAGLTQLLPVTVWHVPYAAIICFFLLKAMIFYPYFKWWIDTRNWYGNQCGAAPKTDFVGQVRWFPKTFDPKS